MNANVSLKPTQMGLALDQEVCYHHIHEIISQAQLAKEGYRIRCYVPYGAKWYPYYTRRLAEKPSHLWMVLKHMFH